MSAESVLLGVMALEKRTGSPAVQGAGVWLHKIPYQWLHHIDGDGEADGLGGVDDEGVDPDGLAEDVEQGAAAVSRIDGRIGLNHMAKPSLPQVEWTILPADHPQGDGMMKTEGITDRK